MSYVNMFSPKVVLFILGTPGPLRSDMRCPVDPRRAHPPQQLRLTRLFAPKIEQPLFFPAEMDSGTDWFNDQGPSVLRAEAAWDSSTVNDPASL